MSQSRDGQVVTFYSYKGGTGRSMALANVAWVLAAAGKRVLVVDWDLESPGLQRFFAPFLDLDVVRSSGGVIDLIRAYEDETRRQAEAERPRPAGWYERFARVEEFAFSLDWDWPGDGALDLLSAGRQNNDYAANVAGLDWANFLDRLGGGKFFAALRQDMKDRYDYTFIDSRTGFSDVARICTIHLPDTLVTCFTLSDQGIDGAAEVAQRVHRTARRPIRILPVSMRVDQGEKVKVDNGRAVAMKKFAGLPSDLTEPELRRYWGSMEVPYRPFYAFEETLATFGDAPGSPTSLLSAYEKLAATLTAGEVTGLREMDETTRESWRRQFERQLVTPLPKVVLQYAAEDQLWAEWVEQLLQAAKITVVNDGPVEPHTPVPDDPSLEVLYLVSAYYRVLLDRPTRRRGERRPDPLGIYVSDIRPQGLDFRAATSLVNLTVEEAAAKVFDLLGVGASARTRVDLGAVRYPGAEPTIRRLQQRFARFTGRADDLRRLREHLKHRRTAVVLPVALQGMGGVGKTQLALEYAHRFRSAYDIVWWVTADPPHFVNSALADLATEMGLTSQPGATEAARALIDALQRGVPTDRWLLIFDNAEDLEAIREYLPAGNGHVIITSRNTEWGEIADPLHVDVFKREESVAHLRARRPSLSADEADRIGEALGDLPIAVAGAAAWLAETGLSVDDYLQSITQTTKELAWRATWDLSLNRLKSLSPAAYRLLQICSVMAPDIALELLYSDEMASALVPLDPSVSDRLMRGTLIQQINRLGLLRLDNHTSMVTIHRLIQSVVQERMGREQVDVCRHVVHRVLAKSRPNGDVDDPLFWPGFRMLWPHLEISDATRCVDEDVRQLFVDRLRYLWRRGDLDQAVDFADPVVVTWTQQLAELSPPGPGSTGVDLRALERQLLQLRFNLANILRDQSSFKRALKIDTEVLERQTLLLGATHSNTLMTAGSRAADLRALGHFSEALPFEMATHRAWSDALGDEHPRVLAAANNLAASYRAVGDFGRARELDENVYRLRRRILGPTHPYSLHSGSCLGRDLREAGAYGASVDLLRRVYDTSRQALGLDAQGTLSAQANLATSLRSCGHPEEAQGLLEDALRRLGARFGADNPHTLACRLNLGVNLLALGRTADSVSEIGATTQAYESGLGAAHPLALVSKSNLSAALRAGGRQADARVLAEEASSGCGAALGDRHPFTLAARMNVATCLYDKSDVAAAHEVMAALVDKVTAALGVEHPDALSCLANALVMGSEAGRTTSDDDLDVVLARLTEQLGEGHPTVRELRAGRPVYRLIDPSDPF